GDELREGAVVRVRGKPGVVAGLGVVHAPAAAHDRTARQAEQLLEIGPRRGGQRPRPEPLPHTMTRRLWHVASQPPTAGPGCEHMPMAQFVVRPASAGDALAMAELFAA